MISSSSALESPPPKVKGKFLERFQHLPDIAGAVKVGVAHIGQDEIFRVLEVSLNLAVMVGRFKGKTFQQFRAERVKQRFKFDDDGGFLLGIQLEIHKAGTQPDLRQRGRVKKNFRQGTKQAFGGSFGLGPFLQLVQIGINWVVSGFETRIGEQWRDLDFKAINQPAEFR